MRKISLLVLTFCLIIGLMPLTALAATEGVPEDIKSHPLAKYLYEVSYDEWDEVKAEAIGETLRKPSRLDEDISEDSLQAAKKIIKEDKSVTNEETEELIDNIDINKLKSYFEGKIDGELFDRTYGDKITSSEFVDLLLSLDKLGQTYKDNKYSIWEELLKGITENHAFECTSCRTGNLIGRNFDWGYDDVDEFIMHVPGNDAGRHASIGVASAFFDPKVQKDIGIEDILPMLTMDGVNDAGVAINVNVVASSDIGDIVGVEVDGFDIAHTSGTNDDGDSLCAGFVVRYVLDNADSAANAIELLKTQDIYSISGNEFHWMISDENETYIVECVDNQLVVLKSEDEAAMSNFHVTNSPHLEEYEVVESEGLVSNEYTKFPMGIERYEAVKNGLDEVETVDDMLDNMHNVWYMENLYVKEDNTAFWSDMNCHPYTLNGEKHLFEYNDEQDQEVKEARLASFEKNKEFYKKAIEKEAAIGKRIGDDGENNNVVQTVHTSAYDIYEKTLTVNVQERETYFTFKLTDEDNANSTGAFVNGDHVGPALKCNITGKEWYYEPETKALYLLNSNSNAYKLDIPDSSGITVIQTEADGRVVPATADDNKAIFYGFAMISALAIIAETIVWKRKRYY